MSRAQEIADLLSGVTITTADNLPQLTLKSTDADGGRGPELLLTRDSASPADGDGIGFISWTADNDAGADHAFCGIEVLASDVSDGSEDATWQLFTQVAGTSRSRFSATPTETVLNEDSIDLDFRVESNGSANMLFVDGGNDKVGINTGTPARQLTVENTIANAGGELGLLSSDSDTSGTFGTLHFGNNTDTSLASIRAKADGSTTAGKLEFNTEPNGGAIETRMTIDSSGDIGIGTSTITNTSNYRNIHIEGTTGTIMRFMADGTQVGQIQSDTNEFQLNAITADPMIFKTTNTEAMRISAAGEVTKALQPAFLAQPSSQQQNIQGDTNVTVVLGTERFDVGSNFASNTFTAPVTGKYFLSFVLYGLALPGDATYLEISITTSNRGYVNIQEPSGSEDVYAGGTVSCLADMDANDTAFARVTVGGSSTQFDIGTTTTFSGALIC